jgi:hypothetical protein
MPITMNADQRGILFTSLLALLIWFIWFVNSNSRSKRQPSPIDGINTGREKKWEHMQDLLQALDQQPLLENARLTYLRNLPAGDLYRLVLLALSRVGYQVSLFEEPTIYQTLVEQPGNPLIRDDPSTDPKVENRREAKLDRTLPEVLSSMYPEITVGPVTMADGRLVLMSIQTRLSGGKLALGQYSRVALGCLEQACQLEKLPGLLVYLELQPATSLRASSVVLLSGTELLSILEGVTIAD